jgi:catechol-2,3-dioxygenase
MLNKSNVVAFVATSRPENAKSFYEQTLGLRLVTDDAFAIVFDANGVMLRVQKVQEHTRPIPYQVGMAPTSVRASRSCRAEA